MNVVRSIALKYCTVEIHSDIVYTRFPDGTYCPATAHHHLPHSHVIAHRLGYGDDLMAYVADHEFCHSFLEQALHDRPSRVLWGVAHDAMLTGRDAAYEEMAAQVFARWLRANERPILAGCDWDALKAEAMGLLDG